MAKKLYYKVVRAYPNKCLLSCFTTNKFKVEYLVGEFVYPTIGLLFVFSNFTSAFGFAEDRAHWEVWTCEALRPRKIKYMASPEIENDFVEFWGKPRRKHYLKKRQVLRGTYGALGVKLLERVWW